MAADGIGRGRAAGTAAAVAVAPAEAAEGLPRAQAYRALFVLALVSFMNYVDRMVLPAVAQPIKLEFGLSDTELGLLNGFAFVLLYALSGVPLARLADRTSRPLVLGGALAFWSLATVACGLAKNFGQLLAARAAVGIGESACQPVGYAMVSDYFPPERRGTAIAWFLVGNSLGVTAGFALGGWIGAEYGWRTAFIAVGLPGLLLAVFVARLPTVRALSRSAAPGGENLRAALRLLLGNRAYRWLIVQTALYGCAIFGPVAWLPAFYMRSHELPMAVVGTWTGLAIGFGMGGGMLIGGLLGDRVAQRGRHRPLLLAAGALFVSVFVLAAALWTDQPRLAIVATFVAMLFASVGSPINATVVQNEAPAGLRATAASLQTLAISLIGIGLAPFLIGLLSDVLAPRYGVDSLRYALLASLGLSVVTALMYLYVAGILRSSGGRGPAHATG